MFTFLLASITQVAALPFLRCLYNHDFSVDTVLRYTTYATGGWVVFAPAIYSLYAAHQVPFVGAWMIVFLATCAPLAMLSRITMVDLPLLIVIQLYLFAGFTLAALGGVWWLTLLITGVGSYSNAWLLDYTSSENRYGRQFRRYVQFCYRCFRQRYGLEVCSLHLNVYDEQMLYALMIIENANNPYIYRLIENAVQRITKRSMTTGIMQVAAAKVLSDEESIVKASEIVRNAVRNAQMSDADTVSVLAEIYNGDASYEEVLRLTLSVIAGS